MKELILGIDPGYDRVGWAVGFSEKPKITIVDFGCIQTNKQQSLYERYMDIDAQLTGIINNYHPHILAIESLFFFKNAKTAMHVSEARGVIISCCLRQGLPVVEYTPLQIKQVVTGSGKADKTGVAKMVRMQLQLPKVQQGEKIIDDAMDALAIVMTRGLEKRY